MSDKDRALEAFFEDEDDEENDNSTSERHDEGIDIKGDPKTGILDKVKTRAFRVRRRLIANSGRIQIQSDHGVGSKCHGDTGVESVLQKAAQFDATFEGLAHRRRTHEVHNGDSVDRIEWTEWTGAQTTQNSAPAIGKMNLPPEITDCP